MDEGDAWWRPSQVSALPSTSGKRKKHCFLCFWHLALGKKTETCIGTLYPPLDDYRRIGMLLCLCTCRSSHWHCGPRLLEMSDLYSSTQVEVDHRLVLRSWRRRLAPDVLLIFVACVGTKHSTYHSGLLLHWWKVRPSDVYLEPGRTDFYLYLPPPRLISRPHFSIKYGPSFVKRSCFNILTVI
jgi:hypothetical protein